MMAKLTPEVIFNGSWISEDKDEDVSGDDDGVQEEQDVGLHHVADDVEEEAEGLAERSGKVNEEICGL